jgi:hypothetical protein
MAFLTMLHPGQKWPAGYTPQFTQIRYHSGIPALKKNKKIFCMKLIIFAVGYAE